jgi:hypothetical protein
MIYVKLTNGFGNNLFQYNAAKVLAEHHKTDVMALPPYPEYYGISALESLGVKFVEPLTPLPPVYNVTDKNYVKSFSKVFSGRDMLVYGYFEDYRYFVNSRERIKSWYPETVVKNDNDLVLHFRTGDRLFFKNEFHLRPRPENYVNAISSFDFERLHIVTDMPCWEHITVSDLESMKFHSSVPKEQSVSPQESVDFFNSFIDGFSRFDPVVENRDLIEDFNFLRGFKNILFEHGTMAWWAAFLGSPNKVGVYGPWRSWKGKSNKNLSQIPLHEWFKWE